MAELTLGKIVDTDVLTFAHRAGCRKYVEPTIVSNAWESVIVHRDVGFWVMGGFHLSPQGLLLTPRVQKPDVEEWR